MTTTFILHEDGTLLDEATGLPPIDLDTTCSFSNVGGWVADGTDTISYGTALPNPTSVFVTCSNPLVNDPGELVVTDGLITLTTDAPGDYTITVVAPPFLTKTITVTATQP